ncbi:hypothetical protein [Spirosoma radiotolerans]|nr:hypothetical protein [Spirosoma radiotolerans]
MNSLTRLCIAASLISLAACSTPASEGVVLVFNDPNPQWGYASGRVVDWQNKPIEGAKSTINNTGGVVWSITYSAIPTPLASSVRVAVY